MVPPRGPLLLRSGRRFGPGLPPGEPGSGRRRQRSMHRSTTERDHAPDEHPDPRIAGELTCRASPVPPSSGAAWSCAPRSRSSRAPSPCSSPATSSSRSPRSRATRSSRAASTATEGGDVANSLEGAGISYQLRDGGSHRRRPVERGDAGARRSSRRTTCRTAATRASSSSTRKSLGATDFEQKVKYQRALEGEIARTIESVDGVRSAQVQLVLPKQSLFLDDGTKASAAVLLQSGGMLDGAAVSGIARLVSSSVEGLKADDVTITDETGRAALAERSERRAAPRRAGSRPSSSTRTPCRRRSTRCSPRRSAPTRRSPASTPTSTSTSRRSSRSRTARRARSSPNTTDVETLDGKGGARADARRRRHDRQRRRRRRDLGGRRHVEVQPQEGRHHLRRRQDGREQGGRARRRAAALDRARRRQERPRRRGRLAAGTPSPRSPASTRSAATRVSLSRVEFGKQDDGAGRQARPARRGRRPARRRQVGAARRSARCSSSSSSAAASSAARARRSASSRRGCARSPSRARWPSSRPAASTRTSRPRRAASTWREQVEEIVRRQPETVANQVTQWMRE